MTVWFTSDLHFRHRRVAELRGFTSADEHDAELTARWNASVKLGDVVWVLGDVGLGRTDEVLSCVKQLRGRKHLVTGNHDAPWPGNRESFKHQHRWLTVFNSVQAYAQASVLGTRVLLSHFPYDGDHTEHDRHTQFRLRNEGRVLLHGHIHLPDIITGPDSVHVGVDAWDLKPVSDMEVARFIAVIRPATAQEQTA